MNSLTLFIIALIIFLLIILAVGFYIYLQDKLEQIKIEKEKTKIERLTAEIKAHRKWQAQNP